MKLNLPFIIVILFSLCACGGSRKTAINPHKTDAIGITSETELNSEKTTEEPIVEVEEKLATINNVAPDPYNYFVIIGSFF
jgi:hypothetical protein